MSIINAKVSFSRIGCTSCQNGAVQKSEVFIPKISVYLEGRKTAVVGYLYKAKEQISTNVTTCGRFVKKDYRGRAICEKFIVIGTKAEYITVGEDAQEHAAISKAEAGSIVRVDAQSFFCRKGATLTAYDFDCKAVGSRELTEEEIIQINIKIYSNIYTQLYTQNGK